MEKRLVAVLAADVAGYSAMMDHHRDITLKALKAFREEILMPAIAENGGRLIKSMGDGWIVEFQSASNAAECAISIQLANKAADIQLRIGVHTGEVITDSEDIFGDGINIAARLEALAEPGQILLSDTAHNSLDRTSAALFFGGGVVQLKNITRRVGVWCWPAGSAVKQTASTSDKPGIAVLPFDNMSGDPEQEFFADGITEDIITELSRFRWLMVVARNSSFTFKGKSTDIREVGTALGVRYVLEGSVRRAGQRVRITGQLIDAENGSHLWADRYDGMLDDIFELQDSVTREVVTAIEPSLRLAETARARAKPTENLEAYELYLQALSRFHLLTDEDNREAIRLTLLALERDPDYAAAAGLLAWLHIQRLVQGLEPVDGGPKAAVCAAERVLLNDRADGIALAYAAHSISMLAKDVPRARAIFKQALGENPNASTVHMLASMNLSFLDRPAEALEHARYSVLLSPKDPMRHAAYLSQGAALFQLGRYSEAVEAARSALSIRSSFVMTHLMLIASLAQEGDITSARAAVSDLRQLRPDLDLTEQSKLPIFTVPRSAERWREGWRLAGLLP